MVDVLRELDRVQLSLDAQSADSVLELRVLDLLQVHSHLGLFSDNLSLFLEHIEHFLNLVQEFREGKGLLVLIVKRVPIPFRRFETLLSDRKTLCFLVESDPRRMVFMTGGGGGGGTSSAPSSSNSISIFPRIY